MQADADPQLAVGRAPRVHPPSSLPLLNVLVALDATIEENHVALSFILYMYYAY